MNNSLFELKRVQVKLGNEGDQEDGIRVNEGDREDGIRVNKGDREDVISLNEGDRVYEIRVKRRRSSV